jgi:Spy/CpxP family protein refolding chaperone
MQFYGNTKRNFMKQYLKIFAPMVLAIIAGLLAFQFVQWSSGNPDSAQTGDRKRPGVPPPPRRRPPPPPPRGEQDFRMLEQLDLSDEQEQQIQSLQEEAQSNSQQYFEKIRTLQEQLETATKDENFNEEAVRQILNDREQTAVEIEFIRLKTAAAIKNLLTPEQKEQYEQLKPEREGFGRRRRPGMQMPELPQ